MIVNRKRNHLLKLLVVVLLGIIFYNELISYIAQYLRWPKVECGETKAFYKVLLVADPQILGEQNEFWLARWDSDRFLAKTFSLVIRYVEPDYIVFLGDLMDEGSVATSEQYARYYSRFKYIYKLDKYHSNVTVFVPGDNDIGGEDEEITSLKVRRYYNHFHQVEHVLGEHIEFVKANKLLKTYAILNSTGKKQVRVMVSHIPILGLPSFFSGKAVSSIQPDIIFSAHEHKSMHFVGNPKTGERTLVEQLISNPYANESPTWRFQIGNGVINEILVPTCSYRMGAKDIGFGLALIDKKGESVCYSILWLPQRLLQLLAYLLAGPVMAILATLPLCCRKCRFWRRSHSLLYN